jgi:capsular polysaccharide biosynthesis protein
MSDIEKDVTAISLLINDMKNQEFTPRESLARALERWWVIVLMTVLGGIAGWTIHFFRPPLYEATAVMTVNMDFEKRELTEKQEDYAFNVAAAISNSIAVKDQIIAEAQIRGFPVDINQLQQQMFLERRQSVWEFHIRNRDPETAAQLASLWAEKAEEACNVALGHSLRADQIQSQISIITGSQSASGSPAISTKYQATLQNLSDELLQEKRLSLGILPIMKFGLTGSADVPPKPVLYYLANLVLAGACIGFIASLWVVSSYKGQRRG